MNLWLTGLACAAALGLVALAQAQPPSGDVATVVRDNSQFAVDLYGRLAKEPGNLFFSPYSISSALAMTYAGARGKTAEEMARTLHLDLPPGQLHPAFAALNNQFRGNGGKRAFELSLANALWGQKGFAFDPQFVQLVQKNYGAALQLVDFKGAPENARQTINRWVENETRDKIKDLIPEGVIDPMTRLVLTNAIYFKAAWEHKFSEGATRPMPFATSSGQKVDVPMMHATHRSAYFESDALQGLVLPYEQDELSLVVLLPKQANGLAAVEGSLTAERLQDWVAKAKKHEVDTYLPKFKVTSQFNLKQVLTAMGMRLPFSKSADFTGMSTEEPLQISEVVHKAYIDLNEKGTEAAAATAVIVKAANAALNEPKLQKVTFRADHPFTFLIRENRTGTVLFMGRIENPK
jgi:serpin B